MVKSALRSVGFYVLVLVGTGIVVAFALSFVPDSSIDLSAAGRFRNYLHILFTFDYGYTEVHNVPVSTLLWDRSLNSLMLIGGAILIVGGFGVSLGVWAALRPESQWLNVVVGTAHALSSIPVLVWAFLLLILSGIGVGIFPNFNALDGAGALETVLIYAVPIVALGMGDGLLSDVIRNVRSEAQRELNQTYIRALRARRVPVLGHLSKGITPQILYVISSKISYLVSGTIVIEVIFNVRGLAWLIYRSVAESPKEYPLVLAATMLFVGIIVVLNLIAELIALWADPRLRA